MLSRGEQANLVRFARELAGRLPAEYREDFVRQYAKALREGFEVRPRAALDAYREALAIAEAAPVPGYRTPADPPPMRSIIRPEDIDLLIESTGHLAGSLTDRDHDLYHDTIDRLAYLQKVLTANRDTLSVLFAGIAPALSLIEE
jgi:hypothetical protein